jgi:hypothetical protein
MRPVIRAYPLNGRENGAALPLPCKLPIKPGVAFCPLRCSGPSAIEVHHSSFTGSFRGEIIPNNYGRCRIILPLYFLSVEAVLIIKVIGSRRASSVCSGRHLLPQNSSDPSVGSIHAEEQGPRVPSWSHKCLQVYGHRDEEGDQIRPFSSGDSLAHCIEGSDQQSNV